MAKPIDCRSEEGIVIGLIDSIIFSTRVLCSKYKHHISDEPKKQIYEALKDLHEDEDLFTLLKSGPYNKKVLTPEQVKAYELMMKETLRKAKKLKINL